MIKNHIKYYGKALVIMGVLLLTVLLPYKIGDVYLTRSDSFPYILIKTYWGLLAEVMIAGFLFGVYLVLKQ